MSRPDWSAVDVGPGDGHRHNAPNLATRRTWAIIDNAFGTEIVDLLAVPEKDWSESARKAANAASKKVGGRELDLAQWQELEREVFQAYVEATNDRPVDIESDEHEAPAFPIEVLPDHAQSYTRKTAAEFGVSTDMVAACALAAGMTAIGPCIQVTVDTGWRQFGHWFFGLFAPPSAAKTPVVERMILDPIKAIENTVLAEVEPDIFEARAQLAILNKQRKTLENGKPKVGDSAEMQAVDLAEVLAKIEEIRPASLRPRIHLTDGTPQALTVEGANNGGGAILASGESNIFDQWAGMYANAPDLAAWCSFFDGGAARIARVLREGSDAPAVRIAIVAVTTTGRIRAMQGGDKLLETGLLQRFLTCLPEPVPYVPGTREPVTTLERQSYADHIAKIGAPLWQRMVRREGTTDIQFSSDALETFTAWLDTFRPRYESRGDLAGVVEFARKQENVVIRTAGILHAMHGKTGPIEPSTVKDAIKVVGYSIGQHRKLLDLMQITELDVAKGKVAETIRSNSERDQTMRVRDIRNSCGAFRRLNSRGRQSVLDELVEDGAIDLEVVPRSNGGRPHRLIRRIR